MTTVQVLLQRLDPLQPARIQSALTPGERVASAALLKPDTGAV